MIFSWFSRVVVKVGGDESHVWDSDRIMLSEVMEIEKISGLSYMEWKVELNRFSMAAVAPLLHMLRRRAGQSSDFATMQFNVADLDVLALKEDGTEMTPAEMLADIEKRKAGAEAAADPTSGGGGGGRESTPAEPIPDTSGTSLSSPNGTASAHGSSRSSRGATSARARTTSTHS